MVEIRLKKCCLSCECPKIYAITEISPGSVRESKRNAHVFCDREEVCAKLRDDLSGYINA